MHPAELATNGACFYVRTTTGITLPPTAVRAAFRLFGATTLADRILLLAHTAASPRPPMRRLRGRAVHAVHDYVRLVADAPHLQPVLRLDFCLLLGLYAEVTDIDREQALRLGLVDTYCHLAALVDGYDDLIDAPEARTRTFTEDDFRTGPLARLREHLVAALRHHAHQSVAAAGLEDHLEAFERAALRAHQRLDQGTGLDAPLAQVLSAREATSGSLLRLAAHIWNALLDLPEDLSETIERAAATFGVVAQFADDVIDWTTDVGSAQNLLDAALLAYPTERHELLKLREERPGWSVPATVVQHRAPQAYRLLNTTRAACMGQYPRDRRFLPLLQFGDDVYFHLLPALPAMHFGVFDAIRDEVQGALRAYEACPR